MLMYFGNLWFVICYAIWILLISYAAIFGSDPSADEPLGVLCRRLLVGIASLTGAATCSILALYFQRGLPPSSMWL
jgi:RsiW-degrading membrane proteinase PrsW (M82 family)